MTAPAPTSPEVVCVGNIVADIVPRPMPRLPEPGDSPESWVVDKPMRIFTPEEEYHLTSEARGYLMKLCATEILSPAQFESVIDHAFECWVEEIDINTARLLAAVVLLHESFAAGGSSEADAAPPSLGVH